ncbi:MAG TPA: guanylate kinase [Haliscomenobacter sp.]|uniref:guanylate kinase n=1 Tax=Haliscomenobacter sp. TaxID=2717303 RepID=UPI002C100C81|nr:guanylate kinase [Haliscomenobacter sp.]HOY18926.1 guanylate kinase [Haliscomenobacter sp.]
MSKLIILTAPSGAGKTTIVRYLLETIPEELAFSISATTRARRSNEVEGKDYYYIGVEQFQKLIEEDAFAEWEEVYPNQYYGTLHSEMNRIWQLGKHIVFDIDVKGAVNLKKAYPDQSLAIFVKPPSKEALFERLRQRKTENEESLRKRLAKAEEELTFEHKFDYILVNDVLEVALAEALQVVRQFTKS